MTMPLPPRRFRSVNHLTLPQGLQAGPGATHMRVDPGEVVTLDGQRCFEHSRFVNGRVRAGDLVELTLEAANAAAPIVEPPIAATVSRTDKPTPAKE